MAKIEGTMSDPKSKEYDFITEMVNELFKVAKESPLPIKESIKADPISFIADAIQNRQEYRQVWLDAKEKLKEKYKGDSDVMEMLSNYFEKGIKPTFSKGSLDKAIGKYIAGFKKS